MHCPFTSEISVKRKQNYFNHCTCDALFLLFDVRDNVGRTSAPLPHAPPFTHLTELPQERSARKKD